MPIIEAIYENGVLRPLQPHQLQEQQRYRLLIEQPAEPLPDADPALRAELERRTSVLADGRVIINLLGLYDRGQEVPDFDEIEAILDEFRREQEREWDELGLV